MLCPEVKTSHPLTLIASSYASHLSIYAQHDGGDGGDDDHANDHDRHSPVQLQPQSSYHTCSKLHVS